MRHFQTGNVTTEYEPIFIRFMFGRFCVYRTFLIIFGKSATNDTSLGRYGAERGNEGKPQPIQIREGVT